MPTIVANSVGYNQFWARVSPTTYMYTVKKPNPDMEINPTEETVDFGMNKVTLEPLSKSQMNEVMTVF